MKKVMLFLMLACFTLGSSGFKTHNVSQVGGDHCFEDAHVIVQIIAGEVNIDNIDVVLWLTAQCEMSDEIGYYPWDGQ
jgi:hypothetical protein